jgi:hypothetical protein
MANKVEEAINRMKKIAQSLVSKTFPNVSMDYDQDLIVLKSSEILIDGYTVVVFYSISDFKDHKIKSLQIHSKNHQFLPFNVACKIAKKFLGNKYISLIEIFSNNRKIYCWTQVCDEKENPIMNPYSGEYEHKEFGDFDYYLLEPNNVNFY